LKNLGLNHDDRFPAHDDLILYGLGGDIVRAVEPITEAHPIAVLAQLFAAFGTMIDQKAWFRVGEQVHHLKFWPILVGITSRGRKGVSWSIVERIMREIDLCFVDERMKSGLSTGEGLIWSVRDPIIEEPKTEDGEPIVKDKGVEDKRFLVIEEEFASILKLAKRDGAILSPTLRQAWDTGNLQIINKNSPCSATGAHIGIIGHITKPELLRNLDDTEAANGFANRFCWLSIRRTKLLPSPPPLPDDLIQPLIDRFREVAKFARTAGELVRSPRADRIWAGLYRRLATTRDAFLVDAILSRGEAQVTRLACLYALLDKSRVIEPEHLIAAWYFWEYSQNSARYIFGDRLGDPVADRILEALSSKGSLTRTGIQEALGRNVNHNRIETALEVLKRSGLATMVKGRAVPGKRAPETWLAVKT